MKEIPKKHARSKAGFTMAETLIAILILLMVSAIIAGALPTASSVFAKTVDSANAQMLLSTTMTVLRDELGTASDVQEVSSTAVSYNNGSRQIAYSTEESPTGIWLTYYNINDEGETADTQKRLLVSAKASTENMVVSFTGVTVDDVAKTITFTGLKVTKSGYSAPLASQDTYVIRVIS